MDDDALSAMSGIPSHPVEGSDENLTPAQMATVQGLLATLLPEIVNQVQQRLQSPLSSAAQAQAHQVAQQTATAAAHQAVQQAAAAVQQQAAAVATHTAHQVAQHAAMAAQQAPLQALVMKDVLKNLRPPPFSGENRKNDLKWDEFSYRANSYFEALGLNELSRMTAMAQLLTGDANLFWRTHIEGKGFTYAAATDALCKKFTDHLEVEKARAKLRAIKYKGSVSALVTLIDRLCLHIPNISESERIDRFTAALPSEIRVPLAVQTPGTVSYAELCDKAERIDHAIKGAKESQPSTSRGGSSTPMEVNALSPSKFVPKGKPKGKPAQEPKPQAPKADGQAAKLPKLTPEEKERLKEQGLCFRCRVGKHTALECPLRKNAK